MKKFLKTYKSVIILLAAIIIGAIVGIAFKEKAAVLKPFGDIFLNLLFVVIVPLIFLSITTSIAKIKEIRKNNDYYFLCIYSNVVSFCSCWSFINVFI